MDLWHIQSHLWSPDTPKMVKNRVWHVFDTDMPRYVPIRVSEKYRAINIYFYEKKDRYVSDTANLYSDTANLYSVTDTSVLHVSFQKKRKISPILLFYIFPSKKKKKKKIIRNQTTSLAALSKTYCLY